MAKRAFRKEIEPQKKNANYPTLDAVDSDRRGFLKRLGLGILGVGAASGLMACGDRALGDKDSGPEPGWDLSGVTDASPPPEPDIGPQISDGGVAPMPDLEPDWQLGGVARQPDAGDTGTAPQPDWQIGGARLEPDAGAPRDDASADD